MKEKICKNCVHYRRHYILHKDRCTPVNCGHCIYPGLKNRKPDKAACVHFKFHDNSQELPDRQEVVNYLTTDFLKGILKMTIPPEIGSEDEGFD